jgi:hypothetical protein
MIAGRDALGVCFVHKLVHTSREARRACVCLLTLSASFHCSESVLRVSVSLCACVCVCDGKCHIELKTFAFDELLNLFAPLPLPPPVILSPAFL